MYLFITIEVYKVPLGAGAQPTNEPSASQQRSFDDDERTPSQRGPYKNEDETDQRPPYTDEPEPTDRQMYVNEEIQKKETDNEVEGSLPPPVFENPPRSRSPEDGAPPQERTSTRESVKDDDDSKDSKYGEMVTLTYLHLVNLNWYLLKKPGGWL